MARKPLPLRQIKEVAHTGCSKLANHRLLPDFQRFEIPYKFPKFPQIFGAWIVRRIKSGEPGAANGHPCMKAFDEFLDCTRHHPSTYGTKCRGEAGKCLACLEEHKDFKPTQPLDYMHFLEHFRVFTEGKQSADAGPGKFRYRRSTPGTDGAGSVLSFTGYRGGDAASSGRGKNAGAADQ
eukprot:TRINITY_DN3630_c0_g2_i1.p1 TRINITY_DN3630_c0_g2~~TRINITY_DN3630_c0_g2_i1.p1  ORF type:complete len:180 (+),score=44.61 TRINITY_DN3630_c0_g2_i1:145-684(+)